MFNQNHRVRDIICLGILAIVSAGIASGFLKSDPQQSLPLVATLYLAACFLGGLALYVFYLYHREMSLEAEFRRRQMDTMTVEVRLAEAISRCSDKALDMMQSYMPMGEILSNELGEPTYTINLGKDSKTNLEIRVPLELVQDYFDNCTAFHTCPVNHWSQGAGRFAANQLTDWFVMHGYARPFTGGNTSAPWMSVETYRRACEMISKYGVIVKMTPTDLNKEDFRG